MSVVILGEAGANKLAQTGALTGTMPRKTRTKKPRTRTKARTKNRYSTRKCSGIMRLCAYLEA